MATTQRPDTITLTLTERAAAEVQKFIAEEKADPATAGLRVGVQPGGCSGFKYALNIEDTEPIVHFERFSANVAPGYKEKRPRIGRPTNSVDVPMVELIGNCTAGSPIHNCPALPPHCRLLHLLVPAQLALVFLQLLFQAVGFLQGLAVCVGHLPHEVVHFGLYVAAQARVELAVNDVNGHEVLGHRQTPRSAPTTIRSTICNRTSRTSDHRAASGSCQT